MSNLLNELPSVWSLFGLVLLMLLVLAGLYKAACWLLVGRDVDKEAE